MDGPLSHKEKALIEAARRELAAKPAQEAAKPAGASSDVTAHSRAPARRAEAPAVSPLDVPTVLGWDNPAAQTAPKAVNDKWARIAPLMDAERQANEELRHKARRNTIAFLAVVLVLVAVAALRMLLR